LCFERRYPKQNTVSRINKTFPPSIFWTRQNLGLATPLWANQTYEPRWYLAGRCTGLLQPILGCMMKMCTWVILIHLFICCRLMLHTITQEHNMVSYSTLRSRCYESLPRSYATSWYCCNHSDGVALECAVRHERNVREEKHYAWREQAIIEWSWHVNSIVACCHSAKLCVHADRALRSQRYHRYLNCNDWLHIIYLDYLTLKSSWDWLK